MTPSPQRDCPVAGCEYSTPVGLPNYDLVYRDLEMHTKYGHPALNPVQAGDSHAGAGAGSSKADKLPRPTLKDESTEADFIFFKDSWTRDLLVLLGRQ